MDSSLGQDEDPLKAILNLLPPEGTQGSKNSPLEHRQTRDGAMFDFNSPPNHNLSDIPDNFELPMFNIDSQHVGNNNNQPTPFKSSKAPTQSTLTTDTLQFIDLGLAPPERRGRSSSFSGSVLSEVLLNPNLPFMDAMLQFLGYDGPPTIQELQYNQLPHGLFFDQEIQLGGLVSSTNLNDMLYGNQAHQFGHVRLTQGNLELLDEPDQNQTQTHSMVVDHNYQRYFAEPQQPGYGSGAMFNMVEPSPSSIDPSSSATNGGTPAEYTIPSYLADPMAGTGVRGDSGLDNQYSGVTISIDAAPEAQAARTPSLFSNSLHGSLNNSPAVQNGGGGGSGGNNGSSTHLNTSGSYQHLPVLSPGPLSDYSELLKPEEYAQMRRGRKVQHSAHRLRSRLRLPYSDNEVGDGLDLEYERDYEDDNEDPDSKKGPSASREKMLELALPNQVMKRTQKHPSVYACHLCEKRFTRPYNLKSHLRTHTDERPFICNVCGKAFARQHDRKRHEDLHSGEKKYQCRGLLKNGQHYGCGRKFARADALRRHFQTETGKECIRLLLEEDERERDDPLKREGSEGIGAFEIPTVAILPPD